MDKKRIGYWLCTGFIALVMGGGGIVDILQPPEAMKSVAQLGYPSYFYSLLGVWKLAAAAVLLSPRLPRLKEWAYAGIMIDLTAASYSHMVVSDPVFNIVAPLVFLGVAMTSWYLRPVSRKLLAHPGEELPSAAHRAEPASAALR